MNLLFFYTEIYAKLHNYKHLPVWVLTPLRRLVRRIANKVLPKYLEKQSRSKRGGDNGIVISLTSFPARINDVWMVIESLKNQSVIPEKILLWLSKEQFPNESDIPSNLKSREDDLFEIRLVDEDIRSHKKYYYAMLEYPNKTIVTFDDDVFYHPDALKCLLKTSKQRPNSIIANHVKRLTFNRKGELLPYSEWSKEFKAYSYNNNVQIGIGGVLYPVNALHAMVLHKDIFMKLAPLADDLWLNAMARLKGTPVVQGPRNMLPLPILSGAPKLTQVNNGIDNLNDKQIMSIRNYMVNNSLPDVYSQSFKVGR